MRNLMLAAIAASVFAGSAMPGQAAIKNLGDCYNTVISACNKKKNDDAAAACSNSGMDQCDKQFGNRAQTTIPDSVRLQMRAAAMRQVGVTR